MPPIPKAIVKAGYKPQSVDTSADADVLMFNLLRRLSCEDKVILIIWSGGHNLYTYQKI